MTTQITLDASTVKLLSPACKAEIAAHLGFDLAASTTALDWNAEDGDEFAELGIQAARAFLKGCGEKTTEAIRFIVNQGDTFTPDDLADHLGVEAAGLRGTWTGLTKRVRTVTGEPNISLLKWEEDDDGNWHGQFMPVTRESFRRALSD